MESHLPILHATYDVSFRDQLLDLLRRNYTDIFRIFDRTAVADPAAMGNQDGEIGALTFSEPPTQAQCQALRDACEELADDARNIRASLCEVIDSLQARDLL